MGKPSFPPFHKIIHRKEELPIEEKNLFQRFIGGALELIIAGVLAAFITEMLDSGRGYNPNPVFWKAFILTHVTFLIGVPLFFKGRTLGMLLTNITVLSINGNKPNILQIIARAVLGFVPVILSNGLWYFITLFIALTDKKGRGWSEIVSCTEIKRKSLE
ncbi:RDD family protein [Halobacillus litoralis]|uniref:RDD family protein n=1 Tax=Halobacillus litoralis TaxID=45668 RepID=UPI001CFCC998|nr:RDD family protein [Halobacillus litoralis]